MYYLLDTNICIYFLKGRFGLIERFERIEFNNLFISEITIAKLKFGAEKSAPIKKRGSHRKRREPRSKIFMLFYLPASNSARALYFLASFTSGAFT